MDGCRSQFALDSNLYVLFCPINMQKSPTYICIYICFEDVRIIHVLYAPDVYNELHIAYLPEPQSELYKTIGRTDHCGHSKF